MSPRFMMHYKENPLSTFRSGWGAWVGAALLVTGALWMLPHGRLHDYGTVPWFLSGAAMMLGGFYLALRFPPRAIWMFWGVAVGVRLVLLFQVPGDDIYRYVWEGRILLAGWNPYLHPPDSVILESLRTGLWTTVQHKTFTAIYPPLAQWMMALLATLWASPIFFKAVFALADLVVAGLLMRRFGKQNALFYAWNPLVIYSFAGGGHYDSIFILAMVLGWFACLDQRRFTTVIWLGTAVALKWLALPLLVWVGWQMLLEAWKTQRPLGLIIAIILGAAPMVVSFAALCLWTGEWTLQLYPSKFSQYARSAEFIPGIVGWFWEQSKYHNHWFAFPMVIAWGWIVIRGKDFARSSEGLIFATLILSPMLHAWYFTWIIPFAVATRNRGTILVTASVFVYFLLPHHVEAPGGQWLLKPWETALLWLPFVFGFLWSAQSSKQKTSP